jgi:hypothetical protein
VNQALGLPWQSTYYYFHKWKGSHFLHYSKDELVIMRQTQQEQKAIPEVVAVDSQS